MTSIFFVCELYLLFVCEFLFVCELYLLVCDMLACLFVGYVSCFFCNYVVCLLLSPFGFTLHLFFFFECVASIFIAGVAQVHLPSFKLYGFRF